MIRHNGITLDRKNQTIYHRGRKRVLHQINPGGFRPVAYKLWEALILGPLDRATLFDRMYGEREDGGPLDGIKIVDIRISQWKYAFKLLGLQIVREKRCGVKYYRLVPIDVV
jgi:hypothetical protein